MKIGIAGCGGRMGRALVRLAHALPTAQLGSASERVGSPLIGKDAGIVAGREPLGVPITAEVAKLFADADVVIDFTSPESSLAHAREAAAQKKALVIGTTGFSDAQKKQLQDYAGSAPVLWSPNMSLGVAVVSALVENAAKALDTSFDIEILEMHHRHKVDAPSGTALALGKAAARGRNVALAEKKTTARDGHTGARKAGDIGFAVLRGGDVVGEHTVIFAGAGERIEISHKAENRDIFAAGALRAAQWLQGKKPGFYSLKNMLESLQS